MSKLRDLLASKASVPAQPEPAKPAPTIPAAKPSFNALLKQAKAKQADLVNTAGDMTLKNEYVPPPSAPIEDFQNLNVTLTTDVTAWPDTVDGFAPPAVDQLRKHLQTVEAAIVTGEVSEALNNCLRFIHDNPNMRDLLLPDDVGTLVQALSSSASVVITKKNENKSTAKKRKEVSADVMNAIADIGF
jgi:hypothetical protein